MDVKDLRKGNYVRFGYSCERGGDYQVGGWVDCIDATRLYVGNRLKDFGGGSLIVFNSEPYIIRNISGLVLMVEEGLEEDLNSSII